MPTVIGFAGQCFSIRVELYKKADVLAGKGGEASLKERGTLKDR